MRRSRDRTATRDRGAALPLALAAVVALSALAGAAVRENRTTVGAATRAVEGAQARAAAEAGVAMALAEAVATIKGEADAAATGAPRETRFQDFAVTVTLTLERGRVDLNLASPQALEAAARAAGVARPAAFAAAVSARRAAAAAAGVPWRLDARPFVAVAQARAMVEPTAWLRLAPLLTVHGASAADPAAMPDRLAEEMQAPLADAARPRSGDVARVVARAARAGQPARAVEALAALSDAGWRIVDWRPGHAWR